MTIQNRNLTPNEVTEGVKPNMDYHVVHVLEFAAAGSDTTYPVGMLLAYNTATDKWVPWVDGGSNGTGTVSGIVGPRPHDALAAGETLGNVALQGKFDFVALSSAAGDNAATLAAALRAPTVREKGLIIENLSLTQ
ncbi:MAG TPA: hypothetical protein DF699_06235 [Phycisphaerales bacterium]|nr:hypothetical protein [Phycisphaerales bacterium]